MSGRTRPAPPRPLTEFVIEDVEALKAIADPQRLSLLLHMAEPKTVKELAQWLGVPKTRLYYHVRKLEAHGFIRVAQRRMVSGIEERSYQAVAESWTVSGPLMSSTLVRTGALKAMLDLAAAELTVAIDRATVPLGEPDSGVPVLSFTQLSLSASDIVDLQGRMQQIMIDFGKPTDGETDKPEYHALFVAYRTT